MNTINRTISKSMSPVYFIERPQLAAREEETFTAQIAGEARRLVGEQEQLMDIQLKAIDFPASVMKISPGSIFKNYDELIDNHNTILQTDVKVDLNKLLSGSRIIAPPYDTSWHEGAGMPWSKLDGSMITMPSDGFSASGFGCYFSSPHQVAATIEPIGTYQHSWAGFENYPALRGSGGLGVCVYRGTESSPIVTRLATLWRVNGVERFKGETHKGELSEVNAGVNEPGFFRFPLVPVNCVFEPGVRYLFWIWTWQSLSSSKDTAFIAVTSCKVPLIRLSTSAPAYPVLH